MPLRIVYDDRLEQLADALIGWFARPRQRDALAQDTVVVPDLGTGRWVAQRIALAQGVCARVRFELPGRFFWRTLGELIPELPARSPFEPQSARWSILQLFDRTEGVAECLTLHRRVRGAAIADRLALAGEIAAQFERYLVLRRDWLDRWQAGRWAQGAAPIDRHEAWQRWLWRELLSRLPDVSRTHPYERLDAALAEMSDAKRRAFAEQSVGLIATAALSREQMDVLARLSRYTEVAAFVPDPCREMWSDLVDPKSRARIEAERPDLAWLYEDEPQVLGLWGRAQRDRVAQWQLLEDRWGVQSEAPFRDRAHRLDALCMPSAAEVEVPAESPAELPAESSAEVSADSPERDLTRLSALHTSILLRSDRPWALLADPIEDASIQLHATHGAVRSAEVLHDRLLDCFATMPNLRPDQVIVFCADLEDAADAIESVFASAPPQRVVPIAVSARRARADPMQRAALELLEFARAGATLAALEQWLANPLVLEVLSLDPQQAGDLLAACETAGVHWGLDEDAGPPKHNWRAGLARLVLGAALGGAMAQVAGVAPTAGLRRVGYEAFERLLGVLDAVRALHALDRAPRPVAHWCAAARDLFQGLFGKSRRHADALVRLLASLDSLRDGASFEPESALDARAFHQALVDELDRGAAAALPSGAVTVCPIGALRAVGFRVVALFGLDETAFPRAGARGEFDLIAAAPRFGDRAGGVDDRGVFLDAVLAARERLIVLYTGRDPRDDTARNPSTLVSELQAYVNARQCAQFRPLQAVVHPLHPFSPRAFASANDDRALVSASFASQWEGTARALSVPLHRRGDRVGALRGVEALRRSEAVRGLEAASRDAGAASAGDRAHDACAHVPLDATELDALRAALADPAKAYLRAKFGVALPYEQGGPQDVEPLVPDPAGDRHLVDSVARRLLAGEEAAALLAELEALAQTAAGAGGEVHARTILASAQALSQRAAALASLAVPGAPVTVSAYKLGMHALIGAWLVHAEWAARRGLSDREGEPPASYLVTPDACVTVRVADPRAAIAHARASVMRITEHPLALFPRTAREILSGSSAQKVHDTLLGSESGWTSGEIERPWNAALHRDAVPSIDEVTAAAREVYAPILADCAIGKP